MSNTLGMEKVSFSFGDRPILVSISMMIAAGECVALLGANGTGKSTLLDIVAGIRQPASGTVSIAGRPQHKWSARDLARRVSHLPQSVHADLPFSAEQLVAMGRYPHTDRWFESTADHVAIEQAMLRTRCAHQRQRRFSTLSGGERQRVLLAACLAQDADILLLDEPSTFLDIDQQLHCFRLLREEAARGKACIAVSHDLNLALTYCTRLIVLAEGAVAHDMTVEQAHQESGWLALFSPQLRMTRTPEGAPWIFYQPGSTEE